MNEKIETPVQYMMDLDWNKEILDQAKAFLIEWDKRDAKYYRTHNFRSMNIKFDKKEREHYRNCINFWEKRPANEIK